MVAWLPAAVSLLSTSLTLVPVSLMLTTVVR
jgi:hypothetical protein